MAYMSGLCICGSWVANSDAQQTKHLATKKHLKYMEDLK